MNEDLQMHVPVEVQGHEEVLVQTQAEAAPDLEPERSFCVVQFIA